MHVTASTAPKRRGDASHARYVHEHAVTEGGGGGEGERRCTGGQSLSLSRLEANKCISSHRNGTKGWTILQ